MLVTLLFLAKFFGAAIVGAAVLGTLLLAADYFIDPT